MQQQPVATCPKQREGGGGRRRRRQARSAGRPGGSEPITFSVKVVCSVGFGAALSCSCSALSESCKGTNHELGTGQLLACHAPSILKTEPRCPCEVSPVEQLGTGRRVDGHLSSNRQVCPLRRELFRVSMLAKGLTKDRRIPWSCAAGPPMANHQKSARSTSPGASSAGTPLTGR